MAKGIDLVLVELFGMWQTVLCLGRFSAQSNSTGFSTPGITIDHRTPSVIFPIIDRHQN
jgi:hypothetical protein